MEIGMMWFDNDPKKALQLKIDEAASYLQRKYGLTATVCMVNSKCLDHLIPGPSPAGEGGNPVYMGGVEVRTMKAIIPGHLWIGVEAAP